MALIQPKKKPRNNQATSTEYDFQPSKSSQMSAPPPGTNGSDYVPQTPRPNQTYTGNYNNVPNPTYRPASVYENLQVANGGVQVRPQRPRGVPTSAQLQANPAAYGLSAQDLAGWQAGRENTTEGDPFPTVGSNAVPKSSGESQGTNDFPPTPTPSPTFPTPGGNVPGNSAPPPAPTPPTEGPTGPGNSTPGSVPGANPGLDNNIPGSTGNVGQQRLDDFQNWWIGLMAERDAQFGGENGSYGNNFDSDGNWIMPDWLSGSGLMDEWNTGANTDAMTREVGSDETVEGRLARMQREDSELNMIARENAREQAAASGMLGGSSAAEGAALRASREAMLPVAQQDASWYGQTARDNQTALNTDALADQQARTGLIDQSLGLRANLYESASDRTWRSKEANQERLWKTMESGLDWLRQSTDREDQQDYSTITREDEQSWNAWQQGLQRDLQRFLQDDDQVFQGTQQQQAQLQERSMAYFNMVFGREGMFANTLNSIYSNPNLTPAQQQQAAQNAGDFMRNMWNSFNSTLAGGIPQIFTNPYGTNGTPNTPTPNTPTPGTPTPGGPPAPTTPGTPNPNIPADAPPQPGPAPGPEGTPEYAAWVQAATTYANWYNSLTMEQLIAYGFITP